MSNTSTPIQNTKKRDLSSPEFLLDYKKHKFNVSPEPCDTNTRNIAMATNISLGQDAIQAIAAALKDTIQSNIEVMLQSSIQTIVEGVIFGLKSKVSKLEEENSNLKSSNEVLTKRVRDLELRSDAAEQYSKRNCLRNSGLPESDSENTDDLVLGVCEALQTNINVADIDRSHRLGRPKQTGPREIRNVQSQTET
ncbi:hypothetical protein DPMN_170225 [Dreissena polymorpha]|uniref:Uncharacterized protein n=1 Tax=Dreissena polymorpha TaxID=45954 RepID=A0A9D4IBC1_DREPO|nr:hypothetical protein DPMN_170225 [Dreissena polymorpha]